jgi:hypothetical protein
MKTPASKTKAAPKAPAAPSGSAWHLIDTHIGKMTDWRGATLSKIRSLIHQALPDVIEEWKWDIPVWSHNGIICTGESYKAAVKTTFARGAALDDPARLFNSSLAGATRRAIDFPQGAKIDETAFKALIRAAAALNAAKAPAKKPKRA